LAVAEPSGGGSAEIDPFGTIMIKVLPQFHSTDVFASHHSSQLPARWGEPSSNSWATSWTLSKRCKGVKES